MAFNKFQGFTLLISFLVICLLNVQSYDFAEADQMDLMSSITDTNGDIDTQSVERVTRRYLQFLPQSIRKNGKLVGGIIAAVVVIAAILKYYMSGRPADWRKYMEGRLEKLMARKIDSKLSEADRNTLGSNKTLIEKKVKRAIEAGNATPYVESSKLLAAELKKAQSKLDTPIPDMFEWLRRMARYEPLIDLDPSKDYVKALREEIEAGKNPKIDEQCKTALNGYDSSWQNLNEAYTAALSAEALAEKWLLVLGKPDSEIIIMDLTQSVDKILNTDKA